MNFKNLFIGIFLLSLIVLSFSVISAQDEHLEEFLRDNMTQITVTVSQNESLVDFFLDTSTTSFDHQDIDIQNKIVGDVTINKLVFSFDISKFLGDINWKAEIERGGNIMHFNELNINDDGLVKIKNINITVIDGSSTITYTNSGENITTKEFFQKLDLDNMVSINNYLRDNPLSAPSETHVIFTKHQTDYSVWNDEGYGDIPSEWKTKIRNRIREGVEAINIQNIFDRSIAPFLTENDIDFDYLDMSYTVDVDPLAIPLAIQLKDGTYTIPVTISHEGTTYIKDITLILQGIQNEEADGPVTNGIYTPTNLEVSDYLIGISGLGANTVNISLFDVFSSNLPSNVKSVIKYMEISVSTATSGTIKFKVPTSSISNPSLVSLYVLEGGTWTKLPTTLVNTAGGFYEYEATTTHFSTFMIMETSPVSSGGDRSRGGGGEDYQFGGAVTSPTPTTPTPIVVTPPVPTPGFFATITGAIIGALGTGGLIIVIIFIIAVVGLMVVLRIKRGKESIKGGKLNEKGDKNEK
jgi:uncharacterized protein YbdZ (MbtH family)